MKRWEGHYRMNNYEARGAKRRSDKEGRIWKDDVQRQLASLVSFAVAFCC